MSPKGSTLNTAQCINPGGFPVIQSSRRVQISHSACGCLYLCVCVLPGKCIYLHIRTCSVSLTRLPLVPLLYPDPPPCCPLFASLTPSIVLFLQLCHFRNVLSMESCDMHSLGTGFVYWKQFSDDPSKLCCVSQLTPLHCWVLFHSTDASQLVQPDHPLKDVSSFGLLQIKLGEYYWKRSLCEH